MGNIPSSKADEGRREIFRTCSLRSRKQKTRRACHPDLRQMSASFSTPRRRGFDRLREAGNTGPRIQPRSIRWPERNKSALDHRDHSQSLLIVDGRIALPRRAINVSSVYFIGIGPRLSRSRPERRTRTASRRHGVTRNVQIERAPVVAKYQKLFLATWENQKGEPLAGRRLFSENRGGPAKEDRACHSAVPRTSRTARSM